MGTVALIGVDWGSSSFRAWAMDATGAVVGKIELPAGILAVPERDFDTAFETAIGTWLDDSPSVPIIASGMITSRNGWCETPYLSMPVRAADLAAALVPFTTKRGRTINFVTGIARNVNEGLPDVMRGEETELVGHVAVGQARKGLYVLPGTHSKWANIEDGAITGFGTYMTGEFFAILSQHSILGRLYEDGPPSERAFCEGLVTARQESQSFLSTAFSARSLALFGRLSGNEIADYLSGLLIGTEVSAALVAHKGAGKVTVIGRGDLADRYQKALLGHGIDVVIAPPGMAGRGLYEIAQKDGLI